MEAWGEVGGWVGATSAAGSRPRRAARSKAGGREGGVGRDLGLRPWAPRRGAPVSLRQWKSGPYCHSTVAALWFSICGQAKVLNDSEIAVSRLSLRKCGAVTVKCCFCERAR